MAMSAVLFDLEGCVRLATGALLGLGLPGWRYGVAAAVALATVRVARLAYRSAGLGEPAVQAQALYLAMRLLGLWEPLGILHAMQLAGVGANALFGYCAAGRVLSLMPWNRNTPLTARLVASTLLAPPQGGSLVERVRQSRNPARVGHAVA